MTTSMNAQSILSTFGNYDWLNDDGLGLCDDSLSMKFIAPHNRTKANIGRVPMKLNVSMTVPNIVTNPKQVNSSRERVSSSPSVTKARYPTHRRRGRKGKSNYRGVCVTREGKWRAVIYKERKQLYLGVFESEIDAAKAHDKAARQHFGDQAMVNFLEPHEAESMQHIPSSTQISTGTASPVSGACRHAKPTAQVSLLHSDTLCRPITSIGSGEMFPEFSSFSDDPMQDDCSSLMAYDFSSFHDIPILEDSNDLFEKSLPNFSSPIDFGELCFL